MVVIKILDWWCKINYSNIADLVLSIWVLYSKKVERSWLECEIEVWRNYVPWKSITTEYLWIRFPNWLLISKSWAITNETFQGFVDQLITNIWDSSPITMNQTESFKDFQTELFKDINLI